MMVVREFSGDGRGLGIFFRDFVCLALSTGCTECYRLQDKQRETMNQRAFEGFLSSFMFSFFLFVHNSITPPVPRRSITISVPFPSSISVYLSIYLCLSFFVEDLKILKCRT